MWITNAAIYTTIVTELEHQTPATKVGELPPRLIPALTVEAVEQRLIFKVALQIFGKESGGFLV